MSLNTSAALAKLNALTVHFDDGVSAATPMYPQLCTTIQSTGAEEDYAFLGAMPGMREWLGDRQFKKLRGARFAITNREWESSVEIERTSIEDDKLGMYGPVMAELGAEAMHFPDELLFDLIKNGESTQCYDGQYFFDTDHSWGDSGSQSNDLSYTCVNRDAPTIAEFRAAYEAAVTAMLGFKNDQGKTFIRPALVPNLKLMVVVPPNMKDVAVKALTAELTGGGDTNVIWQRPMSIVPASYFSSLNSGRSFDIYNLGSRLKPFIFQARRPLTRQMKGLDDREFKDVKFMTDARYNVGYGMWNHAVRTTLANA